MKDNITIKQIPIGPFQVFTYLLVCIQTLEAVVIDPAGEEKKILDAIEKESARVKYILNTHGHGDHVIGNDGLKKILDVPVCMHEADDNYFQQAHVKKKVEKELGLKSADPVDIKLKDNDILEMGNQKIEVIHTPGHTPGSVCYMAGKNLFTGDTLFVGSAGRTDLVEGSLDKLIESLEKKLIVLPKDTVVWPGHHYGETLTSTIGREMEDNPYITDFILC